MEAIGKGIGALLTLVLIVLVTLKLTGETDLSWWAVTAPWWIRFLVAYGFHLGKSSNS